MEEALEIRKKCPQFRILIIGRANAGKTTILKKICNSTEGPIVLDHKGNKIDAIPAPNAERGEHDIEQQMVFMSNPGFIFHDSRGFEAGSDRQVKIVQNFIERRARALELKDKLHAIWYCLSTDSCRPMQVADELFFNECGTGNVPVVVIFTKFDGLITNAFAELREEGSGIQAAKREKFERAEKNFEAYYRKRLDDVNYPPKGHVRLQDMHMEQTQCLELIEKTAGALDDNALKQLFVSVQQNNLKICIKYACWLMDTVGYLHGQFDKKVLEDLATSVLKWFPHVWRKASQ